MFEDFDLGRAERVEVRSWTVGAGRSAELLEVVLEVHRPGAAEPDIVEVPFPDGGPTLAQIQRLVAAINRQLRQRGGRA